ncbi:unnamed protein product [Euphydryas editha]|uniref:Uncharacterized protein n=1 Tax=Euphydryas editha TaxID=104508 RepID=A0AAU9TMT3_EUPED|nr:unnamed protein product [Euphydryas editha]
MATSGTVSDGSPAVAGYGNPDRMAGGNISAGYRRSAIQPDVGENSKTLSRVTRKHVKQHESAVKEGHGCATIESVVPRGRGGYEGLGLAPRSGEKIRGTFFPHLVPGGDGLARPLLAGGA